MGINTSVNSGAVNYTSKSNSNVTKKVQVSGWEVAAGISASTDEVKLEELNVDENINSINSESFQKLADFVQQKCVNQRDTISFDELKKTDEFKQLLTECGFEEISFDSYVQYKKWEQLQIVNQELSEGKKNLTEITKTRKNFYDEVTEILGQDLNYTLTEYNNEVSVTLNNYEGDFTNNLQRVVEGGRISDEQDLETYSKIIFEVLNKSESTSYTQDDIKNALSGKNDNFSDIYNEYTNNIENLREVLKSNYPPMTSAIEALEQQYNKKLEGSNLTISDVNDTLKMYDFYIAQIEQQNQVNEQNKIQLSYSVIMETNDYKNFNEDTSYEQKLKKYITNQITNTNQVSYEKYQEEYPNSNISPLQFYKCVYENYKDFTVSINGISGKEKEQMKNLLEASKYNPDLLKMYNYIYCTQGIDAANKYIKNTESNVNEIIAQVNVQSMLDDMKLDKEYTITLDGKEYNYSIAIKNGKLAIKGLGDGIENFFNGLKGWFNSSETKTVEEWEQYYFLLSIMKEEDKKANGLIDENGNSTSQYIDFSKDYYSIGGQEVYNISSSIGNMLPSMLLSTINPMLGTVALGTSAGGNSFRDAVTSGYDISKAIMYGLASGISEAALERLLGSIPGLGKTDETFVPNISTWLKSCYNEGKEEFIQEGFDILLRGVIFGEEIDLAEAIKQMGVAGVYGAITGGIMNGVAFPFKAANLDANLEIIAEANDGTLTNAQIAEMFGTTEKYVSEFMEERKSKNTTQNTTQNTNTKESKNTSVSTETARETTQTIKQELNITDPKFDGILSQIGYKVQAGKITMEEAKGIANVYKELGYYALPLKYGQDIYEISIKTEGKYSIQEIFEVYNQGNGVVSQEDIIEMINKTYSTNKDSKTYDKSNTKNLKNIMNQSTKQDLSIEDRQCIETFLDWKKSNPQTKSEFLYFYKPDGEISAETRNYIASKTFEDGSSGQLIGKGEGTNQKVKSDCRIIFTTSSKINPENMIEWINALNNELKNNGITARAKQGDTGPDAFILYLNDKDLDSVVKILDNLKSDQKYGKKVNDATLEFGRTKAFAAPVSESSYYALASDHLEYYTTDSFNNHIPYNVGGEILSPGYLAYTSAMSFYLNEAYNTSLEYHNGDASMITADEIYNNMKLLKKDLLTSKYGVPENADIPLWMSAVTYSDCVSSEKNEGTYSNGVNTSNYIKKAREATKTIKQELNITDPNFDGILSQIGYKVQAGKITMEEAKGIANVYKELGYYALPLKYGQDIYEISIKTEGKYSIKEIFEVYNQGNSVLSQEDIIEIINKTYDQSQQTTRRYVNYYSNVFDSFGKENYGVDQGGINKLSTFWYNGKQYTYTEAMQLIERAKYNGEVIPSFYEQKTTEYNELKNKLIGKYNFNEVEASIIMNTVDDAGACSYASVCNEIFSSFIGKESEFLQAFGYPMYKYENGNIKFNSNELLLDLYVFANMRENGGNFIIKKNDGTYTLNRTYLNLNRKDPTGRFLLQADDYQKYMSTISGKNNEIINSFLNSKGYSYESKTITTGYSNNAITQQNVNDVYNHICNGGTASLGIYDGDSEIKMISCDPRSYPSQTTKNWNGGGHSIFITGIANNGFIVSSWGEKYIIPFADLTSTARFTLVLTNVK